MNIKLPKELRNTTAVYGHVMELFEHLIKGRNITMTHTVSALTLTGSKRSFTFDLYYNGDECATFPVDPCKYRSKLSVMPIMLMTEYVGWCGEIIQKAVDYVDPESALLFKSHQHEESIITKDDVHNYKIDWNKWHETVSESLHAFSFDDAADDCRTLGLTWFPDDDGEPDYEVKAGNLQRDVEQIVDTLIKLYELHWDGKKVDADESGYRIFTKCNAYVNTDGQMYALLKLKSSNERLADPCIEVRLVSDIEHGIPWFEINLVTVGQFF